MHSSRDARDATRRDAEVVCIRKAHTGPAQPGGIGQSQVPGAGSYRPSYEVMLRFYSLYKQAVCGPCTASRPGFWDPVGRYKWDAWSRLGKMSSESAMAAYVDEMKKVAQEVINTMPMNEKTASLFHHFEPLYLVIDDMPQPPGSLLTLGEVRIYIEECWSVTVGLKGSEQAERPAEKKSEDEEQAGPNEDSFLPEDPDRDFSQVEVIDITANTIPNDLGVSEGLVLTSDSESEVFCDSVDSVEQLSNIKEEWWWPFDVSGQTALLFLVWPFVAQGVFYLLRKAQRRSHTSS
ncbi:hypothetical protein F2P81_021863 [Scophthalmus maximus]|uniref:ACB domain-containing protein n=1 Tax=Scophthalmus maximus TaxID=52904 RepID=A0A6A4S0L5_SCOMX|nr:hypothetical protein F2P81_021863 [Scophthalmus maximus]